MWPRIIGGAISAAVAGAGLAACGGSSSPTPTTPSDAVNGTTITIANNAVSPKNIIVPRGTQVMFFNNDTTSHEMNSNPHPEHTDCPEINQVGFIAVGERKLTGNLNTPRVCGYHDHNASSVTSLQGTITIQ